VWRQRPNEGAPTGGRKHFTITATRLAINIFKARDGEPVSPARRRHLFTNCFS
jgi:hypothetical protein